MTTLDELVIRLSVERAEVLAWVERRWLLPTREGETLIFGEADIARAALIRDMRHALELDEEAVPLLLSLIDQVHTLRADLRRLLKAIARQPEEVRRAILDEVGLGAP